MSVCVIFNPAAARGRAADRLAHVQRLLKGKADFQSTQSSGHAEELALHAVRAGFRTVVAAGGDGTVHEVANGVLRTESGEAAFGVIPLGSGNDYAAALELPKDLDRLVAEVLSDRVRQVDVGVVQDQHGKRRFFVNSLGIGLSGAVSWESLSIKRLRGLALYTVATLRAIAIHFRAVDAVLTIDGQRHEWPILYLALALGQREGGSFVIAPAARLDDGLFDYLHAGRLSRLKALGYLPRLLLGRLSPNDPLLKTGQCRSMVVEATEPLLAHVDGEMFARPGENVCRLEIQLLHKRLRIRGGSDTVRGDNLR
jgi:YegS/Rv2252/BmrU family lipid kinase